MEFLLNNIDVSTIIMTVLSLCMAYQFFYVFYVLIKRPKHNNTEPPKKINKFGIIISARNEEAVIGNLLNSIKRLDYPTDKIRTYVIADNCTDNTAGVAEKCGATVFVRNNKELVGKGYALDYCFKKLMKNGDDCDAFIIFDADNLVDKSFAKEMNISLNKGYKVLTSYRNSKNFGTNWITSGYSIWFAREAMYLNNARQSLGTSCAISGTGFCVCREIIEELKGWNYFKLTEDLEFTVNYILEGEKIGFCRNAVVYDEQPESFKVSWNQRMRWTKGTFQLLFNYGFKLFAGIFKKKSFSCYDFLMTLFSGSAYAVLNVANCIVQFVYGTVLFFMTQNIFVILRYCLWPVFSMVTTVYLLFFAMAVVTLITEHKYFKATKWQKICSAFTFPFFMLTYIPIAIVALFKKVEWKPVPHTVIKDIDDMKQ